MIRVLKHDGYPEGVVSLEIGPLPPDERAFTLDITDREAEMLAADLLGTVAPMSVAAEYARRLVERNRKRGVKQ